MPYVFEEGDEAQPQRVQRVSARDPPANQQQRLRPRRFSEQQYRTPRAAYRCGRRRTYVTLSL